MQELFVVKYRFYFDHSREEKFIDIYVHMYIMLQILCKFSLFSKRLGFL